MNAMLQEITIHVYVKILTQTKLWGRKKKLGDSPPSQKKEKKEKEKQRQTQHRESDN
jgi:hypothetical protein